jgi:engulfment and cell motility protein 1
MSSSHLSPNPATAASSSSLSHNARSASQSLSPNTASPSDSKAKGAATNNVTLKDGTVVRVRISDATLTVEDVVRQLCISVKIKDPPTMYALRDENDELVTNDNLKKKIKAKVNLK